MKISELIREYTSAKPGKRKPVLLSLPIEYSLPEWSYPRLAHTVDISEGGLSMHTPHKLENGQNLRVRIYHDSASGLDCTEIVGEVIRVDNMEKSEKEYRCSVAFIDLSSNVMNNFRKFLSSLY